VRTLTDEAIEGDEQFTVSISRVPVTSAVLIGANSIHTVTITDDDDGATVTINLKETETSPISEGIGSINVCAEINTGGTNLQTDVTVDVTTANPGKDYTPISSGSYSDIPCHCHDWRYSV
jgi:hypothetical protein